MTEKILEFLKREWSMEEKALLLLDVLLTGVLLGWLTSPFKNKCGYCNSFINAAIDSQSDETWEMPEK